MELMTDEQRDLTEFAATRSDRAFAAVVSLHLNLVFTTALRQVGDRALAEEIAQNVFLELARRAHRLDYHTTLAGWLYRTTLNQSRQALRGEFRRRKREEMAADLAALAREGRSTFEPLIPLLDEALLSLREDDRLALILHYMERQTFREIAAVLGTGEDAARKRVHRILGNLAEWFRKRGLPASTASLAAALSLEASPAPAATLSATIVKAAADLAGSSAAAGSVLSWFTIMSSTQAKFAAAGAFLLAALLTAPLLLPARRESAAPPPPIPSNSTEIAERPPAAASGTLPGASRSQPETARTKSVFERINDGDMQLTMLSRDHAEAFLASNKTNAESLLTAFRVTHDLDYLRHAAKLYPSDPAVLMRVVLHDAFPEERRAWLDRFAQADPANALPQYLSASEYLRANQPDEAFRAIQSAVDQPAIRDYVTGQIQSLEEIYLGAGFRTSEAKAIAMAAVEMPHVSKIVELANTLRDQLKGQPAAPASSEPLLRTGIGIANHLTSIQDGGNLLGEMVSVAVERRFLEQVPPDRTYEFLPGTVGDRLDALNTREQAIRADSQFFSRWLTQAPEAEIVNYFDRLKLYGEVAAMDWLKNRQAE